MRHHWALCSIDFNKSTIFHVTRLVKLHAAGAASVLSAAYQCLGPSLSLMRWMCLQPINDYVDAKSFLYISHHAVSHIAPAWQQ